MLYLNVKYWFFPSDVKAFLYFKFEKRFVGIDNYIRNCNGFSHSTEDDILTMSKQVWNKNYIRIFEMYFLPPHVRLRSYTWQHLLINDYQEIFTCTFL